MNRNRVLKLRNGKRLEMKPDPWSAVVLDADSGKLLMRWEFPRNRSEVSSVEKPDLALHWLLGYERSFILDLQIAT